MNHIPTLHRWQCLARLVSLVILLLLHFASPLMLKAQPLQVTLQVAPNLPQYLSDWELNQTYFTLRVMYFSTQPLQAKISAQLQNGGGATVAATDFFAMPVLFIPPGQTEYHTLDLFPAGAFMLSPAFQQSIGSTGMLPEDNYRLCVTLVDAFEGAPLTAPACHSFFIQGIQPPELLLPPNGASFAYEALQSLMFQWTPVIPPPSHPISYELRVVQVFSGQNPQEAIQINAPLFQGNTGSLPQSLFPAGLSLPNEPATYAWTVIPLRETGQPMITLEKTAPPFTFSVTQTVTQPVCQCGNCYINGIGIYHNGKLVTPSGGVKMGDNLVFVPNYIAHCPPHCTFSFKGNWQVRIVDAAGNTVFQSSASNIDTLQFPPPVAGKLFITFTGTAFCDGKPCPCGSGSATLDVTVRPGETAPPVVSDPSGPPKDTSVPGKDPTKPPPPETVPQDTIRPPSEGVPVDTFKIPPEEPPRIPTIMTCTPSSKKDPATPISIGAMLSEPALFDYPRAVALRAEGIDYDRVTFFCEGCRSGSKKEIPVRDLVNSFTWQLEGKGSLNVPFDLALIDSTANQIKKLAEQLAALEKKIKELEKEIEDKPAKLKAEKDKAKAQMEEVDKRLATIDSTLAVIADSLASLESSIGKAVQSINTLLNENKKLQKDTAANAIQIDTLKNLLAGKPSPQEEAKLLQVDAARQAAANADTLLSKKRQEILQQAAMLRAAIGAAEQALMAATQAYNSLLSNVEGVTLTISQLETQRFKKPGGQAFHTRQNQWNTIASSLSTTYFSKNPSLLSQLAARQDSVNQKANLAVSTGTPAQREARRQDFNIAIDFFQTLVNGGCNSLSDTSLRKQCQQAAEVLQSQTDAFKQAVENAGGYTLDPQVSQQLETLRQQLKNMEGNVKAAEAGVTAAGKQHQAAVANFSNSMSQLELQKQNLAAAAEQAHNSLAVQENEYLALKNQRETYVENNRHQLQENLHQLELANQSMGYNIYNNLDSIGELRRDTAHWHFAKNMLLTLKQDLETEKLRLKALKANLQKILATDIGKEVKKLKDSLDVLNKEKEKLLASLDSLRKQQQNLLTGNKTASGPIIYYIPPPLEEIMRDKARFEQLKAEVERAEANLEHAYANKAALQGFLTLSLEKIAAELVRYKLAGDEKNALDKTKQELTNKLEILKQQKNLEYQKEQAKLQDLLDETKDKLKLTEQKIKQLEQDSIQIETAIENKKKEVDAQQQLLQQLLQQWGDMKAQRQWEENQLENIKATVRTRNNQHLDEQAKLRELETALAAAEKALGRATARQDHAAKLAAQTDINSLKSQVNAQKTKVEKLEADLKSASNSLSAKKTATQQAIQSFDAAGEAFREAEKQLQKLKDELFQLNEQHRKILKELKSWRRLKEELEAKVQDINEKRQKYQKEINNAINAEEDVAAVQQELNEALASIEDAVKRQQGSEEEATDLRKKMKEAEKDAQEKLEAAKDSLEQAEKKLHEFLVGEFEHVRHQVTLIIRANDAVIDGWRSGDPEAELVRTLTYPGNRTPVFQNKYAEDNPPPVNVVPGDCMVDVPIIAAGPPDVVPPFLDKKEPRTIALLYKKGKPLWKEWPVIPNRGDVLAKDVTGLLTSGSDTDEKTHICTPTSRDCNPPPPIKDPIVDLGVYTWASAEGRFLEPRPKQFYSLWEPDFVPKNKCQKEKEVRIRYDANELAFDPPANNKSQPPVKAAVLIEVPDSLMGAPESEVDVTARIVTGDHRGLAGENVLFRVTLLSGEAKDYGFEGKQLQVVKQTGGDGYAKPKFNFGKGFALFRVDVKWFRTDTCEERTLLLLSPLYLKLHRFTSAPPTFAWEAAKKFYNGGAVTGVTQDFPNSQTEEGLAEYEREIHAVAGLLDKEKDFVNGELLKFKMLTPGIDIDPKEDETEPFGIARAVVTNPPDPGEGQEDAGIVLKLEVECRKELQPVCFPPKDQGEYNTSKIDKFKIGVKGAEFVIQLDEPISRGEAANGSGKIALTGNEGEVILALEAVKLKVVEVVLEDGSDLPRAQAGSVVWAGEGGVSFSWMSFSMKFDSLVVKAELGGGLGGTLATPYWKEAVRFYAALDADGNFLGSLENLPEIEVAKFKLRKGAAFTLDLHLGNSPPGFASSFKGLVIHSAELEFPPIFQKEKETEPTVLAAKDFSVGSSGLSGTLTLTGEGFEIGYGGFAVQLNELSLTFKDNALQGGSIGGGFILPSPMEGTIKTKISKTGDEWSAEVFTENPVSIPRLGLVFSLQPGTGIDGATKTFTLNAVVTSEKTGSIVINGFSINAAGEVKVDAIQLNKEIAFSGFKLHVNTITFAFTQVESKMSFAGGFSFANIGIKDLSGTATIASGPVASVTLDNAELEFDQGPINFYGKFSFSSHEFRGQFKVGILGKAKGTGKGIEGFFVVGVFPETPAQPAFTYWYGELNGSFTPGIALGNTGVALLGIGGGVGYHYEPPIGDQPGAPKYAPSFPFSFKASVALGNVPSGDVFAGRITLVLTGSRFSINGKMWLFHQEENMFGDAQLNIWWEPSQKFDGYVRMFVGLPNAGGNIVRFHGKVNFAYPATPNWVWSEDISGSVLKFFEARANLFFNETQIHFDGQLGYKFKEDIPLAVVTAKVDLGLSAQAQFDYFIKTSSLSAGIGFKGWWDVDLDTPLGTADLTSGMLTLNASVSANPSWVQMNLKGTIVYDLWIYSGSAELDLGFAFAP